LIAKNFTKRAKEMIAQVKGKRIVASARVRTTNVSDSLNCEMSKRMMITRRARWLNGAIYHGHGCVDSGELVVKW
jgi:hypothetical protein